MYYLEKWHDLIQPTSTFDAASRLSTLKDGNGNGFAHAYDAVGNLNQLTYPSGHSLHAQFDPDGNVTQFTNARGQNTQTSLVPNSSAPSSVLHDDGHSEQFVYDGHGRVTEIRDGHTTLDVTYDLLGNPLTVDTAYNGNLFVTTTYGYNPDGSRASMSQRGYSTSYLYDACGRVTDVHHFWKDGLYHYDYDLAGHLIHKKTPQTETDYQYNAVGQLIGLTNYDATHTVVSAYNDLRYDGAGNLLTATVTHLSLNPAPGNLFTVGTLHYAYDSQDHLTHEQSQRNLNIAGLALDLGAFDNPIASDAADNIIQLRSLTFSGNADNQVTTDSNGSGYAYDFNGNPTLEEGAAAYEDAGHLLSYDTPHGAHLQMGYRPDGLLAWKQVGNNSRTYFVCDGEP